jgi:hypothetical protein
MNIFIVQLQLGQRPIKSKISNGVLNMNYRNEPHVAINIKGYHNSTYCFQGHLMNV